MTRWTVNLFYIISFVKIRYRVFVGKLLSECLFIVESQLLVFIRYNGLNKKNGRYTTRCFKVIPENFCWCVLHLHVVCLSLTAVIPFPHLIKCSYSSYHSTFMHRPISPYIDSNLPYITSTGRCQIFPTSKRFRYCHWSLSLSISVLLKTIHQMYVQYVRN